MRQLVELLRRSGVPVWIDGQIGPRFGELAVLVLDFELRLVGYADLLADAAGVPPLTYPAP